MQQFEVYSIDDYAAKFYGGSLTKMAKASGKTQSRVAEWRATNTVFIIDDNNIHHRTSIKESIEYVREDEELFRGTREMLSNLSIKK